jgi:hypothetical protein
MKKRIAWIALVVAAILLMAWWGWGQLTIDGCLDSGGRWNYELGECER